jgi:hypothetical protein
MQDRLANARRASLKLISRVVFGELPPDPARGWRGIAPDGLPVVRLLIFGECAWRSYELGHGTHNPVGYPRAMAQRLVEHGVGLEVSIVRAELFEQLPRTPEELTRHVRLSGPPDVVLVQIGGAHMLWRISPLRPNPRLDPLRWALMRRIGRLVWPATLLRYGMGMIVGRPPFPYPGHCEPIERLFQLVADEWPAAARVLAPPLQTGLDYPYQRALAPRLHADMRGVADRTDTAYIDFADALADSPLPVHSANLYNLNAHGSQLVGNHLAEWVLEHVSAAQPAAAASA